MQDSRQVQRIGGYSSIKFRNGNVGDLQLLPGLFIVSLEYFVERLIDVVCYQPDTTTESNRAIYLIVPGNGEGTILQLIGREVRQNIGNVSGDIGSRGERDLFVPIATNGHFPAGNVKVQESFGLWLDGWNSRTQEEGDVRRPNVIREWTGVEHDVWDTQIFQLGLDIRLLPEHPLGLSFRYISKVRRYEQLDARFLGSCSDFSLNIQCLS